MCLVSWWGRTGRAPVSCLLFARPVPSGNTLGPDAIPPQEAAETTTTLSGFQTAAWVGEHNNVQVPDGVRSPDNDRASLRS